MASFNTTPRQWPKYFSDQNVSEKNTRNDSAKKLVNIQVYLSSLCMMNVHREKISKDKQGFTDRIGRDPIHLQLLFLSDADKSS